MAESILKLRVDSQEYDNKLKRAAEGIQRYAEGCRKAGGTLEHLDEGVEQFVKDLGSMGTAATGAKGKLNEMTKTFTDLSMEYKHLTDQEKAAPFGKALSASLDQLQGRIQQTKADLNDISSKLGGATGGGGGLFGGDKLSGMLQVFGGNLMTKGAGMAVSFVSEMGEMVKQGIELARQGEGIRIAFERLGRGDILDGLREATHGTVTDLELMKAAVKFNDFKLPLDELGTMLAFAQQKAKDTGQSVDYMVDSIVTGLGRKSVMILDNLGLSAAEIKERMKETGDMTKAVGEIIREQMSKAGDYVETAADRALQANVSLQNKMEELGRKFSPLQEASNNLWTSIKIGIMDIVGGPLTNFINKLTEAGRLANQYGILGGSTKTGRLIQNLQNAREGNREGIYQQQQAEFWKYINPREQQLKDIRAWQRGERGDALQKRVLAITNKYGSLDATKIQAEVDSAKKMLSEYQQAAKPFLNKANATTETTTTTTPVPVEIKNPPKTDVFDASKVFFDTDKANLAAVRGIGGDSGPSEAFAAFSADEHALKPTLVEAFTEALQALNTSEGLNKNGTGEDKKEEKQKAASRDMKEASDKLSTFASGLSSISSGLKSLGIDLPEGVDKLIGAIQGISSIIQGVNTVISVFQTSAMSANTAAIIANTAALTANTITNFMPFATGGIAKAANGFVDGNTFSGDQIPIMVNAGELILNRAQQGAIASQLEGGGMRGMQLSAVITGEQLRLVLNNNGRRTGRGEYVTTNFR